MEVDVARGAANSWECVARNVRSDVYLLMKVMFGSWKGGKKKKMEASAIHKTWCYFVRPVKNWSWRQTFLPPGRRRRLEKQRHSLFSRFGLNFFFTSRPVSTAKCNIAFVGLDANKHLASACYSTAVVTLTQQPKGHGVKLLGGALCSFSNLWLSVGQSVSVI